MVYLVRISTSYVGVEEHYLCSELDTDDDIRQSEHVKDMLLSYIGVYPSVEEVMENSEISEEEAYEQLEIMVEDDICIERTNPTLEDLENVQIFPDSVYLYEECEEIEEYKKVIKREQEIDKLLS